jgi:hypothetical protein
MEKMNNIDEIIADFNTFHNKNEEIFQKHQWEGDWFGYSERDDTHILLISAEYFPSSEEEITHIHYDLNHCGSSRFNEWLKKYSLHIEWNNQCILHVYAEDN